MKWISNFKKLIEATILCIRFPFLYPRNRFTGLHYNNWKILEYYREKQGDAWGHIYVKYEPSIDKVSEGYRDFVAKIDNKKVKVYQKGKLLTTYKSWHILKEVSWTDKGNLILVPVIEENLDRLFDTITYTKNKWLAFKLRLLSWIHKYPMQLLFFWTTYTELDAMPNGWRKAFGIKMCKEIRTELLKKGIKALFKYRIIQIKEKYGELRWYDAWTTKEIMGVIAKYEDLSQKICIVCGEKATKRTTGWISPYCDEHVESDFWEPIEG